MSAHHSDEPSIVAQDEERILPVIEPGVLGLLIESRRLGERRAIRIPQVNRLVVARGDNAGTVRTESRGVDDIGMGHRRRGRRPGAIRIPNQRAMIAAGGDDPAAIG